MGLLNKLISGGAKEITDAAGGILDQVITNDKEKLEAKYKLSEVITGKLSELASYQRDVLTQEMKGNWLQRSWRPILMLLFGGLLIARWFGWTTDVAPELELEFMELLKLGIGGYVAGRSLEKISQNVIKNIDMPFLKKKDRKG